MASTVTALAATAAGPASAKPYPPPSIQLPPGLALRTFGDPRDANDELAGTPTTAGTYTFTMQLTDYDAQQATQKFTLTING